LSIVTSSSRAAEYIAGGESAALQARPAAFGKASSYELQFDRLMDDPIAERDALFSMRNCRH